MPQFLTPLRIELVGKQKYKLIAPLVYQNSKYTITLLKAFYAMGYLNPKHYGQ